MLCQTVEFFDHKPQRHLALLLFSCYMQNVIFLMDDLTEQSIYFTFCFRRLKIASGKASVLITAVGNRAVADEYTFDLFPR